MNYACKSGYRFVTSKDLSLKTCLSPEAKARREFIRSHRFSIDVDPSTKEAKVKVTKR